MFNKSCWWLDSNPGPLVSEATALPTAPQPLPKLSCFNLKINLFLLRWGGDPHCASVIQNCYAEKVCCNLIIVFNGWLKVTNATNSRNQFVANNNSFRNRNRVSFIMYLLKIIYKCKYTKLQILPGLIMPFLIPEGSFLDHFATSSSILAILAGFMAHRQPLRWLPLVAGFSIFSKLLFKLKLWRTEFFQPDGAVLK